MIGTISIECNAKNPNMPLWPLRAYVNSPSSLRICNVPKKIGQWEITSVQVNVNYPDKTQKTAQCVLVGGVWVGTVEGSSATGSYTNGYTVIADGIDENGNPVNGYVLGRGDVEILKEDGTPIEDPTHFVTDDELDAAISSKAEISAVDAVAEDLVYLSNSLSDYYLKTETSSAVELDAKFETKADLSALNEVADSLSDYYIKSETSSATELQTAFNNVSVDLSEYYTKSETSSASEISTALALKQDKLSDAQVSAIDSVVDERTTVVKYDDDSIVAYDIDGTLSAHDLDISGKGIIEVKIGNAVTSIGPHCFDNCKQLVNVHIPNSVTTIDRYAFTECDSLTGLLIPESVTNIGDYAFYGCESLTSEVIIPDSVTSIGEEVFVVTHCPKFVIGSGVTNIGRNVFLGNGGRIEEVIFRGKTLAEVQAMANYPWSINDTSIIKTENNATQEWVLEQLSALEARIAALENN